MGRKNKRKEETGKEETVKGREGGRRVERKEGRKGRGLEGRREIMKVGGKKGREEGRKEERREGWQKKERRMGRKNKRKKGKREKMDERQKSPLSLSNNTRNRMFAHKSSTVNTLHGLPTGFLKNSPPIFCVARS
jgi:hypothetical protein